MLCGPPFAIALVRLACSAPSVGSRPGKDIQLAGWRGPTLTHEQATQVYDTDFGKGLGLRNAASAVVSAAVSAVCLRWAEAGRDALQQRVDNGSMVAFPAAYALATGALIWWALR